MPYAESAESAKSTRKSQKFWRSWWCHHHSLKWSYFHWRLHPLTSFNPINTSKEDKLYEITFNVDSNRKCNLSRIIVGLLTFYFERQLQLLTNMWDLCPFWRSSSQKDIFFHNHASNTKCQGLDDFRIDGLKFFTSFDLISLAQGFMSQVFLLVLY